MPEQSAPKSFQTPAGDTPRGSFHVVLVEPQIPQNTGSIGRLCLAVGARLHLVGPLGFEITERAVRKAGLDYWQNVDLQTWDTWDEFLAQHPVADRGYFLTTKTTKAHWDAEFREGDYLIFGAEPRGLPETVLQQYPERCLTIPMSDSDADGGGGVRSLNLATAVSAVLFEGMRQLR